MRELRNLWKSYIFLLENQGIQYEIHENQENLKIPRENNENNENPRIANEQKRKS